LLAAAGCGPPSASNANDANIGKTYTPMAQPGKPLVAGDLLPALPAQGWINGSPPTFPMQKERLLVVDLWAQWCPYCRFSAPYLVRLYEKYSGRGVAFVSLTNMPRDTVEAFIKEHKVPWPNAYGVGMATIAAMGATNAMPTPGYEVAPTLYLVGPDGRIRWCDRQGRYRHTEPKKWAGEVEEAIEAALAATTEKKP
jgi:thiol-disulfide isomerase/thioredoxin